jgi:hypothetical protein
MYLNTLVVVTMDVVMADVLACKKAEKGTEAHRYMNVM